MILEAKKNNDPDVKKYEKLHKISIHLEKLHERKTGRKIAEEDMIKFKLRNPLLNEICKLIFDTED